MENPEEFFNTICRVCLCYGNSEHMVSLSDNSSEDGLSMFGKSVFIFTNISMKNDSLPNKMCPKCLFLLKQAILFKKTCENSNERLTKFVSSIGSSDTDFKRKLCDFVMFIDNFPVKYKKKTHINQPVQKIKDKNITKVGTFKDKSVKTEKLKNETYTPLPFESEDMDIEDPFNYDNTDETLTETLSGEEDVDNILANMELLAEFKTPNLENYRKKYPKKSRDMSSKPLRKIKRKNKKQAAENKDGNVEDRQTFKSEKDLRCTVCMKTLASHNSLLAHMQRHTGGQYICEQCGRIFATKAELKYHLAYTHDIGRQFVCKECGFKSPKMYELMEHERIHTGERPYTCDKCGLTFRRRYIWKKHALYHMEKTVPCQLCPRKFHHNGELVAHINSVHERLYIYACSHCDVTYAKTGTVRRHMTEKHGVPREMQGKIKRIKLGNTSMRSEKRSHPVEQGT